MIKTIFKIFLILILVILQVSLFEKLAIFEVVPNIILALGVSLLFLNLFNDAILVGGIGGLFFDITSRFYFGVNTLFFIAILLIIQVYILKIFPTPKILTSFILFLAIFLIYDIVTFSLLKTLPGWQIFLSSVINSAWAVAIYYLVKKLLSSQEEITFHLK